MKSISSLPVLFIGFCLSSLAGAQAGVTLHVKTDTTCNWKLDGQPMGQLMADDSKVVPISPGYHLVEAFTAVAGGTFETKVVADKVDETVYILLSGKHDEPSKMQDPERPTAPVGGDAAVDQTWTDPATKLMWTRTDNGSNLDWDQAGDYCSKLQLASYKGWRLPTLGELQGIYDPNVSVSAVFNDSYTVDLHVKGNLKITGRTWSDRQGDNPGKPYQSAWFFELGGPPHSQDVGKPLSNFLHFNWSMRALCVRSNLGG